MDIFFKVIAGVLITSVLCLVLSRQGKEISVLLVILVCCMIATIAMQYLESVIDFFRELQSLTRLDSQLLQILLKVVGISLIGELATLICNDAGNAALGKALQMLSGILVLWLSLPLLRSLLSLINGILGEL